VADPDDGPVLRSAGHRVNNRSFGAALRGRSFSGGAGKSACRALVHCDSFFAQPAISGLFAALRTRHDAERSVGKMAAILAAPQ
jgi:hypothetical protein